MMVRSRCGLEDFHKLEVQEEMFFHTQVVDKPVEPFYRTDVVSEIIDLLSLPDCHCDSHERAGSGDITKGKKLVQDDRGDDDEKDDDSNTEKQDEIEKDDAGQKYADLF